MQIAVISVPRLRYGHRCARSLPFRRRRRRIFSVRRERFKTKKKNTHNARRARRGVLSLLSYREIVRYEFCRFVGPATVSKPSGADEFETRTHASCDGRRSE